ncbi:MAG: electron transfer flavoprotein-ubiquinone oxidoreductase [Acidobacteriota bacterium]
MEREILEMDVLLVGAGPANLSCALHLTNLIAKHNENAKQTGGKKLDEINIAVIEKAAEIGAHQLSGAVLDPISLRELVPDFEKDAPLEAPVGSENVYFLTEKGKIPLPILPPPLQNHGNFVISLNKFARWLGEKCEAAGVNIFPEFPGWEMLYEGDAVIGVRTGDKGLDKTGNPKGNFEPGVDIVAKVTVLGEGVRGSLTKQLVSRLKLDAGNDPQVYSVGVKELWEVPDDRFPAGSVIHTMGWPLDSHTFGGSWVYGMKDRIINIGLAVGLDYRDPRIDPHHEFQKFKTHPLIAELLKDGKMIRYGAKAMPVGGWYTIPKLTSDGVMIVGDSGATLNGERLKGIHTAIKSGMLAAETIFEALVADDYSDKLLSKYETNLKSSYIGKELYKSRNFHQGFDKGRNMGLFIAGLSTITGGRFPGRIAITAGHQHLVQINGKPQGDRYSDLKYDDKLTFAKLTDVYYSSTQHHEDQPCHLKVLDTNICVDRCTKEFGNPCQNFCPASVYEMTGDNDSRRLQINFSNCVHCKTCDIMDPYQIINWVPPEGGGGPNYRNM